MVESRVSLPLLPIAAIGLWVLIVKVRAAWRDRHDNLQASRRERLRIGVFLFSFVGFVPILAAQLPGAPSWLATVGVFLMFGSWGTYAILSIVFAFQSRAGEAPRHENPH